MSPLKNEIWRINFFVCTFKCVKDPILPVPLKANLSYLIQKSLILRGWGVDEEWNVPKGWIQQNKIPIVLKLIIVPLVEFSTESKKKNMRKDCLRGNCTSCKFLTMTTRRPFWCSKTIKRWPKKLTLWKLNYEWKRCFGSLRNRYTKPEVSRSYDFLNTGWNT